MEEVRLIKRYPNRKFYDTWNSCYVTMEDIANMIRRGYDVKVIDNKTGDDITPLVLSQLFFEEGKKRKAKLPLNVLKNLIMGGEESITQFFTKLAQASLQGIKGTSDKIMDTSDDGVARIGDLLLNIQNMIEDFQKRIDQKTREFMEKLYLVPSQSKEVEALQQKVEALEKKIAELEQKLKESESRGKRKTTRKK